MTKLESRPQAYKRLTDGIRNFLNHSVGAAKLIHEAKRLEIWKEKWSSWQEYCEKEFGQSRQRAYQLLDVASTIEEIQSVKRFDTESGKSLGFSTEKVSHEKCPASEIFTGKNKEILDNLNSRQATALKGLAAEKKAEVLAKAIISQGGKSPQPGTINGIRMTMADKEPEVQLDETGYPIPLSLLPEWNRATELSTEQMRLCSNMQRLLNEAEARKDIVFNEINISHVKGEVASVRFQWRMMKPYAVCSSCSGRNPKACRGCGNEKEGGKGWLGESRWNMVVPEIKSVREKSAPGMIEQTRKQMRAAL